MATRLGPLGLPYTRTPPGEGVIASPAGSFTLAGQTPIVASGVSLGSPLGTFTLTAFSPSISIEIEFEVPVGSYTLTANVPILPGVEVPVKSFTLSGKMPDEIVAWTPVSVVDMTWTELSTSN